MIEAIRNSVYDLAHDEPGLPIVDEVSFTNQFVQVVPELALVQHPFCASIIRVLLGQKGLGIVVRFRELIPDFSI